MKNNRLELLRTKMQQGGLQAFVISSTSNRRWLSGFTGSSGTLVVGLHKAWLLVDFRYIEQASQQAAHLECIKTTKLTEQLQALLEEAAATQVGFESNHVTYTAWEKLQEVSANVNWVPCINWVEEARACKDEEEIGLLATAAAQADNAFAAVLPMIKPGISEKELAMQLEFSLRKAGAEAMAFPPIVVSGERGALPHGQPSDKAIRIGELITMDFGAVWQGYCSDMTRTVALGYVDERQREIYNIVLHAQQAAVAAVAAGLAGQAVDAVARRIISEAGYAEAFGHGLGHGVGLDVHEEYPRLSTSWQGELQPGMVCSVEPGIYLPGWGGVRIEDLVVVTPDGCRVLSNAPRDLMIIPA